MIIETKFNLGQRVYIISLRGHNEFINCKVCDGIGSITHKGATFKCEACLGWKGSQQWVQDRWKISFSKAKIGKVQVELYRPTFHKDHKDKVMYMVDESGVGSGSCYEECNIFKTEKEALEECNIRNEKLEK